MSKLLTADFKRLWTSRLFWLFGGFMLLLGGVRVAYMYYLRTADYEVSLDNVYFAFTIIMVLLIPLFNAVYIGEEYENGSIRNKIIVGHKRWEVYLSQFIVCSVASLCMHAPYFLVCRLVGEPLLGDSSQKVLYYVVCLLICDISLTAIAMLTSILVTNKADSIIAGLFVALALWAGSGFLVDWLEVNICWYSLSIWNPQTPEDYTPYPNKYYIEQEDRFWVHLITDSLPQGQAWQINHINSNEEPDKPANFWYYSLILTTLCNGVGIALYKKTDLK